MLQSVTLISIIALAGIDQLIKLLVIEYLKPIDIFPLIEGFIQLSYAENTGAAFGSFSMYTDILSAFTVIVIIAGIAAIIMKKIKFGPEYICVAAIIAGGTGNLIDRITRGFVVDYIEPLFIDFAVFNFADMLITCGAAVLIFCLVLDIFRDSGKGKKDEGITV